MALKSRNTALAVALQPVRGTFTAPSTSDLVPGLSNLRPAEAPIELVDDSYTGSIFQNAPAMVGSTYSISFSAKIKPPASLPAANAFILGRFLQAAKFTEIRNSATVPSGGAEAIASSADNKTVTLGSGATGTAQLYRGFPLLLGTGNYKDRLTAIRSYTSGKAATLMEERPGTISGNYLIPTFLGYSRDITSASPTVLSLKFWIDGVRHDLVDCAITQMRLTIPTTTSRGANWPLIEFTLEGTVADIEEEATPSITPVGTPPIYRDGKGIIDYVPVGIQDISIDFGLTAEYPPNPNQPAGNDAPELSGGQASAVINQQMYLPSVFNPRDLAVAQTYHPFYAQWGNAAWNTVQLTIPDGRIGFPSVDLGQGIAMNAVSVGIDVFDRNLNIIFPGS